MSETKIFLIKTDFGEFKSFKELQEYANKQYATLQNVLNDNKNLQEEIEHLKDLLEKSTQLINVERVIKTPAEAACEAQIERLQTVALNRELTLEETKKLDLFIKNQRLLKGDSTAIEGKSRKLPINISDAQLLQIAAKEIKKNNE